MFILNNEANHNDFSDAYGQHPDKLIALLLAFFVALIATLKMHIAQRKPSQRRVELAHVRLARRLEEEERQRQLIEERYNQLEDEYNESNRQNEELREMYNQLVDEYNELREGIETMRPEIVLGSRQNALSLLQIADAVLHEETFNGNVTEFQYHELSRYWKNLVDSMPRPD